LNVCCYISSHGFGHATRTFAVIRELLKKKYLITIRADLPNWLIDNTFNQNNVKYFNNFKTLKVFHHPNLLELEKTKTINYLQEYCASYNKIINNEIKFCRENKFDLIITDIEPSAFEIADSCGIPAIGISNFTWVDIFQEIIPSESKIIARFKRAYNKAELLFRLPFHFQMQYFNKVIDVPLIFRRLTRTKHQIKKLLNLDEKQLIFIQFGGHLSNFMENWKEKLLKAYISNPDIIFLINRFSEFNIPDKFSHFIRIIPPNDVETQDYIPLSIVIGKTGYSLVSEIIGYNSVFIYTIREKWKEDINLQNGIEEYGLGKFYSRKDMFNGTWINDIKEILSLKYCRPKKIIEKYGQKMVVDYISKNF